MWKIHRKICPDSTLTLVLGKEGGFPLYDLFVFYPVFLVVWLVMSMVEWRWSLKILYNEIEIITRRRGYLQVACFFIFSQVSRISPCTSKIETIDWKYDR